MLLSLVTVGLMAGAMESGHGFDLYQCLNYGVAMVWLAMLAWPSICKPPGSGK